MPEEIPAPVPVADLIARRRRGRYYANDGYLSAEEVADAWPCVWNYYAVIRANNVRTAQAHSTGTYGTTTWTEYLAEDVQRVAEAIADGTAVLSPAWRRDTEPGQKSQHRAWQQWRRSVVRTRVMQGTVALVLLVLVLGFVVFAVTH